jgi:hypothetical protein
MDAVNSHNMTDLITARRLLLRARELETAKGDPLAKTRTALDYFEEDQVILSGKDPVKTSPPRPEEDTIRIDLRELIQANAFRSAHPETQSSIQFEATAVEISTTIEESLAIRYESLEPVDGLVLRNKQLAETDRYRFEFSDGSTLKISDKWTGRSTTIWGDPHVDVSDIQGNLDGDFKDLTASKTHTTFLLLDGTRLTITAEDAGIIEAVDIYKSSQHLRGLGAASKSFSEKNGLFSTRVDSSLPSSLPMGDVINAGGDGNDWFDASHRLIWGKTTGPMVTSRPSSYLEFEYNYRVQQQISIAQVKISA